MQVTEGKLVFQSLQLASGHTLVIGSERFLDLLGANVVADPKAVTR
jgi:hypothetical protein